MRKRSDAGYMRDYYAANRDKWRLTEEKKEERNRRRRERYATDEAYRERCKRHSRSRCKVAKRNVRLIEAYGISQGEYEAMFERQHGECAICGSRHADRRGLRLHVDHDHATGVVRGLLCGSCNFGIGKFRDSDELLAKAIVYLRSHSGRQSPDK